MGKIKRSDYKIELKDIKLTPEGRQRVIDHYKSDFPEFLEKWGESGILNGNINGSKIVRRVDLNKIGETFLGWHSCYYPGKFSPYHFQLKDFASYQVLELTYNTVLSVGLSF